MRIGIATDHGGFGLKREPVADLRAARHELIDFGGIKGKRLAAGWDHDYLLRLISV